MPFVLANIFQPLIDVFDAVIRFFHDQVGLSWGLSIIALTVVVRAILVPLTYKQMKSMQAMQKLAPEMKALQAKYKDDKQRQQQELMALYKEHQVNPFGSCLPLVAQMPVFLSLFYMLRHDLRHDICGQTLKACGKVGHPEKFLFVHDITDKATGGVLVVLIVLYIGSQLLSGIFMSSTVDRNQRMLMLGLPFIFTTFIIRFPAGLIVYWITTNLWTVGQGVLVRRSLGIGKPVAPEDEATPKPTRGPSGSGASAAAVEAGEANGSSPAKAEPPAPALPDRSAAVCAAQEEAVRETPVTAEADRVRDLVELVVDALDLDADVEVAESDDAIVATVEGEDLGLFIGRHGQTIEAVQHLAQRTVLKDHAGDAPRKRIVVDAAGYRARRQEALERQADEAADEALRYGRPVALDAMASADRRIVHEHLRDRDDVETYSEGEEPDRHLVVVPLKH